MEDTKPLLMPPRGTKDQQGIYIQELGLSTGEGERLLNQTLILITTKNMQTKPYGGDVTSFLIFRKGRRMRGKQLSPNIYTITKQTPKDTVTIF